MNLADRMNDLSGLRAAVKEAFPCFERLPDGTDFMRGIVPDTAREKGQDCPDKVPL